MVRVARMVRMVRMFSKSSESRVHECAKKLTRETKSTGMLVENTS